MRAELSILFALISCALLACSPKNPEPPKPQAEGVIPQAQLDALNKAKNVENVIMQGEQRRREQGDAAQ
jgi:hypothetical protein